MTITEEDVALPVGDCLVPAQPSPHFTSWQDAEGADLGRRPTGFGVEDADGVKEVDGVNIRDPTTAEGRGVVAPCYIMGHG